MPCSSASGAGATSSSATSGWRSPLADDDIKSGELIATPIEAIGAELDRNTNRLTLGQPAIYQGT